MFALGDQTRKVIFVFAAVKGISEAKPNSSGAVIVVPAHVAAVASFTTLTTALVISVGSIAIVEISAPPKPITP